MRRLLLIGAVDMNVVTHKASRDLERGGTFARFVAEVIIEKVLAVE